MHSNVTSKNVSGFTLAGPPCSFLLCNNFAVRRAVLVFDFKNFVTLKSGSEVTQGH